MVLPVPGNPVLAVSLLNPQYRRRLRPRERSTWPVSTVNLHMIPAAAPPEIVLGPNKHIAIKAAVPKVPVEYF